MDCIKNCQCCLMPLSQDPLGDKREKPQYCSYCFDHGELHADKVQSLSEFQKKCFDGMVKNGMSPWKARFFSWTIRFAPYWKNRKNTKN